ncbi:hypothetical protein [Actinomyces timonensis]|uniref:hypothetical protein n=1 Tax=Actinomyces timonensis TaxID=1288391 RepID=UPI0003716F12|nr:hypothetical protein [Actinomyces timonensis]
MTREIHARNLLVVSVGSFVSVLLYNLIVVAIPGLANAFGLIGANTGIPVLFFVIEGVRQAIVSLVGLIWLRRREGYPARLTGLAYGVAYGVITALLVLLFQLLTTGETNQAMLHDAVAILIGAGLGVLLVKPSARV